MHSSPCPESHVDTGKTERDIQLARHMLAFEMTDNDVIDHLIAKLGCSLEKATLALQAAKLLQ